MKYSRTLIGAAMAIGVAGGASASTIDFTGTDYTFSNTGAVASVSTGGTLTVTSVPEDQLVRTPYDGAPAGTGGALAQVYDGLGVTEGDDEVSFPNELLHLNFSEVTGVVGLHFLDLFFADEEGTENDFVESVFVYLGNKIPGVDAADYVFNALEAFSSTGTGYGYFAFDDVFYGTKITLAAGEGNDEQENPDFALAAVQVVLLPAAGFLLLGGLGGLAALKRRKKA